MCSSDLEPDLRAWFAQDADRARRFTFELADLHVDLSKNLVTDEVLALLVQLAEQTQVPERFAAMLAGEIDVTNFAPAAVPPAAKEGKLKPIAVIVGKRRSAFAGDTPTYQEQGFDLDFRNWLAIVLSPGTPMDFSRRWNTEINKHLADQAFANKFFFANALTPTGGTQDDYLTIMQTKRKLGAELAKIANLRYD